MTGGQGRRGYTRLAALAAALLLPGCAAHHPGKPTVPAGPVPGPRPEPPPGSAPGQTVPEPGRDGHFTTINSGVGAQEALWHVRAALNVAALSCAHRPGGGVIVARYNALLTQRKAVFATAYAAESARFGQAALDVHMTRLYNFFAQPPAQAAFCAAAAGVADRAGSVSPAGLPQFAPGALDTLEAPILDYYRAYAAYRVALAGWEAHPRAQRAEAAPPPAAKAEKLAVEAAPTGASWRIQLGAFTGRKAAEAAWMQARTRVPGLASYQPHYEAVPGSSPLVRLQVGSADDRAGALKLCATAAAGGFDCLPVPRH